MKGSIGLVGWVTVAVLALITTAAHAESTVIRGTNFHQNYKIERITIGKADKPAFGFYENKGVAIQEDGTQAELVVVGTFDRVQDGTTLQGYDIRTYADGSTLALKYEGEVKKTAEGRISTGTYVSCRGTGRFEGVRCEGTWIDKSPWKKLRVVDWTVTLTSGQ